METISFDKLLLKTAFCCMASDGNIDRREVELIKKMCENSSLFNDFDFSKEINILLDKINNGGSEFIQYYFEVLSNSNLTEHEELTLIDFAIKTINADDVVEYSEIKFFKAIRKCLTISDQKIIDKYPEIDTYLEEDIDIESKLDKLINNYLKSIEIPQFEKIKIEND
jgi:uncharacterized tellurite resistance protein B-like protein